MKIILIGASGTIGTHVFSAFKDLGHEIVRVGKSGAVPIVVEN